MKEQTCCLTGHRDLPGDSRQLVCDLVKAAEQCIEAGVHYFGVGGAVGFDSLAAEVLLDLRDTRFPQIRVIAVEPFAGYTLRWNLEQLRRRQWLLGRYNKVVCLPNPPGREAYLARDRYLVDHSTRCIGYCNRRSGGTAYTLRYAMKNGLYVQNLGSLDMSLL
ncbi:SLOG family protein [uncultured Ruthenibacterium sp.]|mgnify:CR=1 FL=1|uniref:SLOG family protein n=1 Tax=uncultured Ruthenibacterium sp. TaxID=1905347 RepID=UPI00349E8B9D